VSAIYGFRAQSADAPGEIARFFPLPSPLAASPDTPMAAFAKGRIAVAAGREGTVGQTPDGRFACVVDGEILNPGHMSRRLEELGCPAPSREAPDIILACRLTGKQEVFREIRGSYVFAVADAAEERVTLGRDMYGTKILYYADTPRGLAFSSSLAALARCPWVGRGISPDGLLYYLAGGYAITPHTLYRDISSLWNRGTS
jgi:asparagine synthase (glutamine-hydrolysing)